MHFLFESFAPLLVVPVPVPTMSEPVVVQGTAVASPYDHGTAEVQSGAAPSGDFEKGSKQETRCRDPIFALLLYANVGAICGVVAAYGTSAFEKAFGDANSTVDWAPYLYAAAVTGVFSLVLAAIMFLVMMKIPQFLIKTSLIFVVILSGVWCVIAFVGANIIGGIIGAVFFLIMMCYARAVWSRIPFATENLITAMTAVKKNCGVVFCSYFFLALAFGWSILWTIALVGIWDDTITCSVDENGYNVCSEPNYGILFGMFVSYFFTHQVIQNTIHVVVAGVVGTWWFAPDEASSCCSAGVCDSMKRALTTSFGSICFGSLIVAIIQALRALANSARANDDGGGILVCIAECILQCLESIVEYFNKWAFIYVGLYGYPYLEAGKNVFTLFKNRGWEAIIADDLVSNTLFFVSVVVGGLAGAVGLILSKTTDWFEQAASNGEAASFILGFVIGLVLTSIAMSAIASGVNAVIVLFAEAPAEFEQNHPERSQKMRETWRATYPGCM